MFDVLETLSDLCQILSGEELGKTEQLTPGKQWNSIEFNEMGWNGRTWEHLLLTQPSPTLDILLLGHENGWETWQSLLLLPGDEGKQSYLN